MIVIWRSVKWHQTSRKNASSVDVVLVIEPIACNFIELFCKIFCGHYWQRLCQWMLKTISIKKVWVFGNKRMKERHFLSHSLTFSEMLLSNTLRLSSYKLSLKLTILSHKFKLPNQCKLFKKLAWLKII